MRLIWWKKHDDYDYELCVETGWRWKKVASYRIPGRGFWDWCDTYFGRKVSDSHDYELTGYKRAIEWGSHNDKERKDND